MTKPENLLTRWSRRKQRTSEDGEAKPSTPLVPDFADNYVQIIQNRDQIALLTDMNWRIATLDGRPHTSSKLRTWSGDARAHWEGETLVIETTNFNNRPRSFAGAGRARESAFVRVDGLHDFAAGAADAPGNTGRPHAA